MNNFLTFISSSLNNLEWLNIFLTVVIKSTLILLTVIILTSFMKRTSSATRHLIWNLAIISLLLLPVLSFIVPVWEVTLFSTDSSNGTVFDEDLLSAQTDFQSMDLQNTDISSDTQSSGQSSFMKNSESTKLKSSGLLSNVYLLTKNIFKNNNWSFALLSIWLIGIILFTTRLLNGNAIIRKVGKQFEPVKDKPINNLVKSCVGNLKINRAIQLFTSEQIAVPITQGWLQPKIILPREALLWSVNRQRSIILHELAHIKRFDYIWNFVANVVTILYWFNPLMWYVSHQHYKENENSCDDIVLNNGINSTDYSQHLVETARLLLSSKLAPRYEMAMARKSFLEGRLLTILNEKKIRNNLRPFYSFSIGLLAFSITISIACLQLKAKDLINFKNNVLTHELSLGDTNVSDKYLLIKPESIVVNDQNDVLVLDHNRIKIFNKFGEPENIVGKPGINLGEFDRATRINLSPTGFLTVRDNSLGYINQFTPDYKFLSRIKFWGDEPELKKITEEEGKEYFSILDKIMYSENKY